MSARSGRLGSTPELAATWTCSTAPKHLSMLARLESRDDFGLLSGPEGPVFTLRPDPVIDQEFEDDFVVGPGC